MVMDKPFLDALASAAIRLITQASSQDVANTAWSFSTLCFEHGPWLASISSPAIRRMRDFESQGIGNTSWALATLIFSDGPLFDALAAAARPIINDFGAQELANTAWSFATRIVHNYPLLEAIAAAARPRITDFGSQQLCNTAWSYAVLECVHNPLLDAISKAALKTITAFDLSMATRPRMIELVFDLTALAWAFEFMLCLGSQLHGAIHSVERQIGQWLDDEMTCGLRILQVPPFVENSREYSGEKPCLLVNLRGMVVVLKPATWEVDGKDSRLVVAPHIEDGRVGLSSFVKQLFPAKIFPLPHLPQFDHGFLHRLDIPSSGLVLGGTTMEGYYSLRLQLNTYRLAREYLVNCHGSMDSQFSKVTLGIGLTVARVCKSTATECGKPAESFVKVITHLTNDGFPSGPSGGRWTIVAVRIRTGRHHQIRTHMLFSDHPTVTDAKYTVLKLQVPGAQHAKVMAA